MNKTLGKTYEQRQLSKEVRDLALEEIKGILNNEIKVEKRFRESLILKLAGSVLPRLNEHSGPEGTPIPILNVIQGNNSDEEDNVSGEKGQSDPRRNIGE